MLTVKMVYVYNCIDKFYLLLLNNVIKLDKIKGIKVFISDKDAFEI